ncbi:CYFA0S01e08086g1_1 [Cyberlindnera fabianii]|uniref:AN1-type zinc finger protein TMC1 n=1 Tax=Cyberlindnera fabianii TaxID=36022 RepID=A0A061AHY5_CYBFA|nr:AN1-type zinc finger protein TMC1 [Cyberlindnera fabianii]CDR37173.1 CYFA0S01e08086g1_1 [Cyberlindnera fabianii]
MSAETTPAIDVPPAQEAPLQKKKTKKSKKLCHHKNCTSQHSIIGDCSFCQGKFCTRHRLLEAHDCAHYRDVQKDYHERNARQLEAQQTVVSKV